MKPIEAKITSVDLGKESYRVYVGEGLLDELGSIIEQELAEVTGCVVVTSKILNDLYGKNVTEALSRFNPEIILVPDGEEAKTWEQAGRLVGEFLNYGMDRKGVVVAFGGGSVGDVAGFAAAIYLRGVRVVQVPTTLLGQVDSSIGGKTAVNHVKGKNLIGAFYQPSLVVSDTKLLQSLPIRELRSGLGEVVKHGVIADSELFSFLEEKGSSILEGNLAALTYVVWRNAEIKTGFVERDEKESSGVRALLNYGHTAGHAIEKSSNPMIRHGEAVAIGMMVAGKIAEELRIFDEKELKRQKNLLTSLGLENKVPNIDSSKLIEVMRRDKKARGGKIMFVLPTGIGSKPILNVIPESLIVKVLEESKVD